MSGLIKQFTIILIIFGTIVNAAKAKNPSFSSLTNGMKEPQQEADYNLIHFWDNVNLNGNTESFDSVGVEQSFVDFIELMNHTTSEEINREGIQRLMSYAVRDKASCDFIAMLAEKHLYEPDSPMIDETKYGWFLTNLLDGTDNGSKRVRWEFQLEDVRKNALGDKATNITYELSTGEITNLHDYDSGCRLLMIFYDPNCETCHEVINKLETDGTINTLIDKGNLAILAVDAEEDYDMWKASVAEMPKNWMVGFDKSGILENDIYSLRQMPTVYLLDADKTIIGKGFDPYLPQFGLVR